jgi:hypothetical protein|uniref:Uncharacterized protein n=1 Tax=uncultured marine virus TaxID=186617 RepID=A0A0F7L7B2_9VIRU|nr:hypothetical protein [uncultured marine virus]
MTFEEMRDAARKAGAGGLQKELRKVLIGTAMNAERQGKLNATTRMNVITGNLRRSIAGSVHDSSGGGLEIRLGAQGVVYARAQEMGYKGIRPKWYLRDGLSTAAQGLEQRLAAALERVL